MLLMSSGVAMENASTSTGSVMEMRTAKINQMNKIVVSVHRALNNVVMGSCGSVC